MLYKEKKVSLAAKAGVAVLLIVVSSCVDHDYDLGKDIDMTIQVGGEEFTIPSSSTDRLLLSQILNLDESSSIKPVEAEGQYGLSVGDYVLVQDGSSAPSSFEIEPVTLSDINTSECVLELPTFVGGGSGRITVAAPPSVNSVEISDNNVTTDIVRLDEAVTDMEILYRLGFQSVNYNGNLYINRGYTIEFGPELEVEIVPGASSDVLELADAHTLRFKKDCEVSSAHPLEVNFRIKHIDFSLMPEGQGIYEPGKFRLESKIKSYGDVSIESSGITSGTTANVTLGTTSVVRAASIDAVTGIVNPEINIESTSFAINGIPDFLKEPGNCLDIENPRIVLEITNTSGVAININGLLTARESDGTTHSAGVGSVYGTDEVVVAPNATTRIMVSRIATPTDGYVNIVQPKLGELLLTIPEEIVFGDIDAKAVQQPAVIELGRSYDFGTDYKAIIPLAFGPDMTLHYTETEADWGEDLSQYSFKRVEARVVAISTIPMDLKPTVQALDNKGEIINDVQAEVEGVVAAGTLASPSNSELLIKIQSNSSNIGRLDGVLLTFDGASSAQHLGVNLNKEQSIVFSDIRLTVYGGVTIDLN